MRKVLSVLALLGALSAAVYFLKPAATSADSAKNNSADSAAAPPCSRLPIAQVVLFSSGVGYFQREGAVEGNTRIDLSFPVENINDLLKSMVLRDLDGGVISTVSYDSNAPLDKTIKSFAINLSGNPAFNQILNQARGEKVEVVLQSANATQPGTLTGTIVGVEQQKQTSGKETVEINLLNLWCADGMRSLAMSDIQRVRFLNPLIDSEFKKALETLAASHDTQKKTVSINCAGEGKRHIKVSYVVENPIWKTSYRLVLDKDKKEKPYLQGWAIVENPTDEDWKDVRMALISGRPISFQMDLYQPLYVPRPVVEPELFASLRPVAYSGGRRNEALAILGESHGNVVGDKEKKIAELMQQCNDLVHDGKIDEAHRLALVIREMAPENPAVAALVSLTTLKNNLNESLKNKQELGDFFFDALTDTDRNGHYLSKDNPMESPLNLGKSGVQSMATAAKLGDFFQYSIDKPVSLPRQKSAMLPIVNKDIEGARVSIYNERAQAKFPLLGLKFKNTSGLHLMQGPITVFEGSNYAGDARILDLQPNEERLISYAVDLGTEVNPVSSNGNGRIVCVKVVKGTIQTTGKIRESKTYTIVNRNDAERVVLVEHPVRNEFKLVDTAKPAETASDCYRFEVKVAASKTETLTVTEEQTLCTSLEMLNTDDDKIGFFLTQTAVSQAVKDGLKGAQALRGKLEKTQREIAEQEVQLKVLTDDQARLRANLHEMPATSAAYKRYLDKFDQQETQIENYQQEIKKLREVEQTQSKEFGDFLANFSVE